MTYMIDKRFDFCYGHRVWTQDLDPRFCAAGENETKCKHMHGHEGSVHVYLESETLDHGFVTDFKHLGWLKDFINAYIDHKFIIDVHDPAFVSIVNYSTGVDDGVPSLINASNVVPLSRVAPDLFPDNTPGFYVAGDANNLIGYEKELLEGFLFVDFVPTSENLAKWIYELVSIKMKELNVVTTQIEWFETPKSRSTYIGNK